jgi:hypothetical protein
VKWSLFTFKWVLGEKKKEKDTAQYYESDKARSQSTAVTCETTSLPAPSNLRSTYAVVLNYQNKFTLRAEEVQWSKT